MLPQLHVHPWMDADVEVFRDQVRRLIAAEITPRLEGWREQGFIPREAWQNLATIGALLPELPEAYGGSGVSLAYQMVVQDELARAEVPGSSAVHTIVAHYILHYGNAEQRANWLPRMASGELFCGIAMTEPDCGSDLKALTTKARRDGGDYVIDGAKIFITNALSGNFLVVAARTGEAGSRGISLIAVPTTDRPGLRITPLRKIGMHASDTCEVQFDGVRVPVDHLLGEREGEGFAQLMSQLPYERTLLGVVAAGVIDRALELTVDYTSQRKAFGQPLAALQNTRFKLAECATLAHVVRTFVNDSIQRLIDGRLDAEAAYMIKWWCTEQQCRVVDECLQLFGGYGYMAESPIARLYADARVQKIYGGSNEVMKDLIARRLFS